MNLEDRANLDLQLLSSEEKEQEKKLRPQNFQEFIGQKKVIQNIELMVAASKKRGRGLDHILLSGPPGLGKTSLAMIIAQELGHELHVISGPALEKKGDLAAVCTNLGDGDILFIDEIHRMPVIIEEMLYSAMEDFRLDIILGQGAAARTMPIELGHFTLVGATTRSGLLSNPLRDRFLAHFHFDFYQDEEIAEIIQLNSKKLRLKFDQSGINELSKRGRGTPRITNRILRRISDYVLVHNISIIDSSVICNALALLGIDQLGLDEMDRKILATIGQQFQGGPVGIDALSATLGEDRQTLEEVYEPFLLKKGLLLRTARGRMLSEKGKELL